MSRLRIGIAAKLSKIEWDMHKLAKTWEEITESYAHEQKDVDKILASHYRQKACIESIRSKCPDAEQVDMLQSADYPVLDMLIVIGGDNFFQLCAHHFGESYLVGVNADPETSHGALLNYTCGSLLPRLEMIVEGQFEIEEWTRVSTWLNAEKLEDATATVSLAIKATDMMSRYLIEMGGLSEEQKATGLLVVSGAGSGHNSWYRNAGLYLPMLKSGLYPGTTTEFSRVDGLLKTLTREPFGDADCTYRMLNQAIKPGEALSLIYWAGDASELSIDSIKRYVVKEGDYLRFNASDSCLKVVC